MFVTNGTISDSGNRFGTSRHPKDVSFVSQFWWGTYGLGAISPRKQPIFREVSYFKFTELQISTSLARGQHAVLPIAGLWPMQLVSSSMSFYAGDGDLQQTAATDNTETPMITDEDNNTPADDVVTVETSDIVAVETDDITDEPSTTAQTQSRPELKYQYSEGRSVGRSFMFHQTFTTFTSSIIVYWSAVKT